MLNSLWLWLLSLPQWLRQSWGVFTVLFWSYACFAPPDPDSPPIIDDKLAHFIGNFGITGSLYIAAFCRKYTLLAAIMLIYALAIELVQWTLPDRYFSLWDMLANALGIAAALSLMAWLQRAQIIKNV